MRSSFLGCLFVLVLWNEVPLIFSIQSFFFLGCGSCLNFYLDFDVCKNKIGLWSQCFGFRSLCSSSCIDPLVASWRSDPHERKFKLFSKQQTKAYLFQLCQAHSLKFEWFTNPPSHLCTFYCENICSWFSLRFRDKFCPVNHMHQLIFQSFLITTLFLDTCTQTLWLCWIDFLSRKFLLWSYKDHFIFVSHTYRWFLSTKVTLMPCQHRRSPANNCHKWTTLGYLDSIQERS